MEHPALYALNVIVKRLLRRRTAVAPPARTMIAIQDFRLDTGYRREVSQGKLCDLSFAVKSRCNERIVLTVSVEQNYVPCVASRIYNLQPLHNTLFALVRCEDCRRAFEPVNGLYRGIEHPNRLLRGKRRPIHRRADPVRLRHSPKLEQRTFGQFGHRIITEKQAPAFMHRKIAVPARHMEILRLRLCQVNADLRAGIYAEIIHVSDALHPQRIFEPPAVINQHDRDRAAEQPRPPYCRQSLFLPCEAIKPISDDLRRVLITAQCWQPPRRFLRRYVNDFCKKPVTLIECRQCVIRQHDRRVKCVSVHCYRLQSLRKCAASSGAPA